MSVLLTVNVAHAQDSTCGAVAKIQSQDLSVATELATPASYRLGGATGVLTQAYDDMLSVDNLIARMRIANCAQLANAALTPNTNGKIDAATYKPKTAFDNTPWRFNMVQNGKQMTADEFDAWMKAKGIRIAKGAPLPQPAAVSPGTEPSKGTPVPAKPQD